jgi:hypothetical protein
MCAMRSCTSSAGTSLEFSFISDGSYAPSTPLDVFGTRKDSSQPEVIGPRSHFDFGFASRR